MTELKDLIARNLRKYRIEAGMSQIELAEKLHMRSSSISNWEKGRNSIDIDTLFRVCEVLKVPISKMTATEPDERINYVVGNNEDMVILELYRNLPPKQQEHLKAYAEFLKQETYKAEQYKRYMINSEDKK